MSINLLKILGEQCKMKKFLAIFKKEENQFSILEHSEEIEILEQDELLILFSSNKKINLNKLAQDYKKEGINFLKKLEGSLVVLFTIK